MFQLVAFRLLSFFLHLSTWRVQWVKLLAEMSPPQVHTGRHKARQSVRSRKETLLSLYSAPSITSGILLEPGYQSAASAVGLCLSDLSFSSWPERRRQNNTNSSVSNKEAHYSLETSDSHFPRQRADGGRLRWKSQTQQQI